MGVLPSAATQHQAWCSGSLLKGPLSVEFLPYYNVVVHPDKCNKIIILETSNLLIFWFHRLALGRWESTVQLLFGLLCHFSEVM